MKNSPIKVTMLVQSYLPRIGGAEQQIANLIPLLRERGVELSVITRRYAGLKPFEIIKGSPVYRIPAPGPKPLAAIYFIFGALLRIYRQQPDVLHAHELLSPSTAAVLAKRLLGVPVLAKVLRGGKLGDLDKIFRSRLGENRFRCYRHSIDRFLVISREIEGELRAKGVADEKIVYLPNGVDTRKYFPLDPAEKIGLRDQLGLGQGLIAIFAGRFAPEKKLADLLQVWQQVIDTHPGAQLVLLGAGEEEARLRALAPAGVLFPGRVEDSSPYLQAADCFILPSETEGLSNALLEAMACGLPVVASAVGGALDVVQPGMEGFLFQPGDQKALLTSILAVFENPERQAEMGKAARESIVRNFSIQATANKLVETYTALLQEKRIQAASGRKSTQVFGDKG